MCINKETLLFGYSSSVFWFRFNIINSVEEISHLLEISYPVLGKIQIFYDNVGIFLNQYALGDKLIFEYRKIQHRNLLVRLSIDTH
jgi:hypothetical protein